MSFRKPAKPRPKEKNVPKGYDSKWEYELHTSILNGWDIHTKKIQYIIEHIYIPDFIKVIGSKTILLETKGRFWDHAEYSKYIWINKVLPKDTELVFLFASPFAPMPRARRRKDGTKFSHSEWAVKNKIQWYSEETFPKSWSN
jgi:hypothetical protein